MIYARDFISQKSKKRGPCGHEYCWDYQHGRTRTHFLSLGHTNAPFRCYPSSKRQITTLTFLCGKELKEFASDTAGITKSKVAFSDNIAILCKTMETSIRKKGQGQDVTEFMLEEMFCYERQRYVGTHRLGTVRGAGETPKETRWLRITGVLFHDSKHKELCYLDTDTLVRAQRVLR